MAPAICTPSLYQRIPLVEVTALALVKVTVEPLHKVKEPLDTEILAAPGKEATVTVKLLL